MFIHYKSNHYNKCDEIRVVTNVHRSFADNSMPPAEPAPDFVGSLLARSPRRSEVRFYYFESFGTVETHKNVSKL